MVKISYRPIKEIVVLDYTFFPNPDKLAAALGMSLMPGQPVVFSWAEGIVFLALPIISESEDLVRQFLSGRMYWSSVVFAPMANYQASVRVPGSAIDIPIIDMSSKPAVKKAAKWLRERVPQPTPTPVKPQPTGVT